jgi:hypothetical protein
MVFVCSYSGDKTNRLLHTPCIWIRILLGSTEYFNPDPIGSFYNLNQLSRDLASDLKKSNISVFNYTLRISGPAGCFILL